MLTYFFLALGLIILLIGGKILVDGASSIASKLGMSSGLIGLTVVAIGTSLPELLVSISAALKGNSDIAIGNVLGSNLSNIGLVLGLSGIFYPILIRKSLLQFDYLITLVVSLIFLGLSIDGKLTFWDGIILFSLFIIFNMYLLRNLGSGIGDIKDEGEKQVQQVNEYSWFKASGLFISGVAGLYIGSELLVVNAVKISRELGISERIIGVTIVSIGTSLPELVTSIVAALSKRTDLAIGNILGSNILNILLIIGVTSIIQPIQVSSEFLTSDYWWMIGITLILYPLMRTKMRISKIEGAILLTIYLTYLYFLI
jgi:cation:H+ antiporter